MPSLQELVERELAALRAVDGVSSATSKERKIGQSLNCSQVKVRLVGHDNPITVHCSARVPDLLVAAQKAATLLAAIVGEGAVAEGRLRAEAACEAEPSGLSSARSRDSAQAQDFFAHMRRISQLQEMLKGAEAVAREADGRLQVALLLVHAEERAVSEAQERLAAARAPAEAAKNTLVEKQAAAAAIREELRQLRSKRQRVAEAPAAAAKESVAEAAPPHFQKYKDYTLTTFMREESKEMVRRAIIPRELVVLGVPLPQLRRGEEGALEHWRRGLVGAVQSWAAGSIENVIKLILRLINHFNISSEIFDVLEGMRPGIHAAPP